MATASEDRWHNDRHMVAMATPGSVEGNMIIHGRGVEHITGHMNMLQALESAARRQVIHESLCSQHAKQADKEYSAVTKGDQN